VSHKLLDAFIIVCWRIDQPTIVQFDLVWIKNARGILIFVCYHRSLTPLSCVHTSGNKTLDTGADLKPVRLLDACIVVSPGIDQQTILELDLVRTEDAIGLLAVVRDYASTLPLPTALAPHVVANLKPGSLLYA